MALGIGSSRADGDDACAIYLRRWKVRSLSFMHQRQFELRHQQRTKNYT